MMLTFLNINQRGRIESVSGSRHLNVETFANVDSV